MRAMSNESEDGIPDGAEQSLSAGSARGGEQVIETMRRRREFGDIEVERELQRQRERNLNYAEAAADFAGRSGGPLALARQQRAPLPPHHTYRGSPELVVAADPFGDAAEIFRELRTQLVAKALGRKTKAALAVVSPGRGDGKSYLAANLAASLAQLGGRTLLIDADLRTPRLHRVFDVADDEGLSSILQRDGVPSLVQRIVQVPGLFFLPAGAIPPNPVELLQSPRFSLLVYEMLLMFDHVIVDTPADSWGADIRLITAKAGAALVVGRKDRSTLESLRALVSKLEHQQVEIAGMVINRH